MGAFKSPIKIIGRCLFMSGSTKSQLLTGRSMCAQFEHHLLEFHKEILIEEYIPGREIQVAIMGSRKLGTIELVPKRKFYDYKAKYDKKAETKHILPVKLPIKKLHS